jgi:hypothetical protein
MVKADLDGEGKPVFTGSTGSPVHVESATTFAEWYRDVSGVNHANAGTLALWRNGNGDYVNRYGANGEQWNLTKTAYFYGQPGFEIDGLAHLRWRRDETGRGRPRLTLHRPRHHRLLPDLARRADAARALRGRGGG